MKVFHVSWNYPETVFHEMPWKKNFTVYTSLNKWIPNGTVWTMEQHDVKIKLDSTGTKTQLYLYISTIK